MIVSYAQNAEDIILNRVFGDRETGFYVDVGAADPDHDSVTRIFYERGWHGVNIEPQAQHYVDLVERRPRDVNLKIGLGAERGTETLYRVPSVPGWSTFSPDMRDRHVSGGLELETSEIEIRTLVDVCEEYADEPIDFLKIDVEGFEADVLAGADFVRFRPTLVVIEATFPERWEHVFAEAGYHQVLWDGVNRFYLATEATDLAPKLESPANILDGYVSYVFAEQLEEAGRNIIGQQAQLEQARDELAAVRGTATWRLREHILTLPGVGSAVRRWRDRRAG